MKIIAETKEGFLLEATERELKDILTSVSGVTPSEIKIGQKIPAIDYASTISKIKGLKDEYSFTNMMSCVRRFTGELNDLEKAVLSSSKIEE